MRLTTDRSRRDDILQAAEAEFGAFGFGGARMDRIAAAARVNKQLLFHYFDSKDGLFAATAAEVLARVGRPDAGTPPERIRQIVAAIQRAARQNPAFFGAVAAARAGSGLPSKAAGHILAWSHAVLDDLTAVVEDGQRRGFFRDDIDPPAVAGAALAAALGSPALDPEPMIGDLVSDYCAWR